MTLIECPECGKEISDKAKICPSCGFPISKKGAKNVLKSIDKNKLKNALLYQYL